MNDNGKIIQKQWKWLSNQYPYVTLDQYIVMPNHLHGIVVIGVGNGRDRSVQVASKIKSLSSLIGALVENRHPVFKLFISKTPS